MEHHKTESSLAQEENLEGVEQESLVDPLEPLHEVLIQAIAQGQVSTREMLSLSQEALGLFGPEYAEEIELLTGFIPHLTNHAYLGQHKKGERLPKEEYRNVLKAVENSTEFNFLLTHYIMNNGDDADHLRKLWNSLEGLSIAIGQGREFSGLKRGILSQVATFKLFAELGEKPELSMPKEDAFDAIDMWTENNTAVQVKGRMNDELFVEVDTLTWPGTTVKRNGVTHQYTSKDQAEIEKFAMKLKKYEERTGQHVKAYYVVIPEMEYDADTGEPSGEIIERARSALMRQN